VTAGKNSQEAGLTFIELLVTLAVVIILATIAVPGFQSMMASNRLASDYNEILVGLNYARSEAVKRRDNVVATMSSDGGAWTITVDHDGTSESLMKRRASDDRVEVSPVPNVIVFNPLGRLKSCSSLSGEDCLVSVGGKNIVIGPSGRIARGE
jgi:type IV fimbrial biogenesis protein FimT